MENTLKNKGHKFVANYMKKAGYCVYDTEEIEEGYKVEFYKTHAGVTVSRVYVTFSENWRVKEVSK